MSFLKKSCFLLLLFLSLTTNNISCLNGSTVPSEAVDQVQEKQFQDTKKFAYILTGTACIFLPLIGFSKGIKPLNILEQFRYHDVIKNVCETEAALKGFAGALLTVPAMMLAYPKKETGILSKKKLFFNKSMLCTIAGGLFLGFQLKSHLIAYFNNQLQPIDFKFVIN